jgi:hypothetical protein
VVQGKLGVDLLAQAKSFIISLIQGRFYGPASLGTCPGLAQNFFFCLGKKIKN